MTKTGKEAAEELYGRAERRIGPEPTQQQLQEYLGSRYKGTASQNAFLKMVVSVGGVSSYTKKDGTEIEGYRKTNVKWTKDDEEYLIMHPLNESIRFLRSKHTEQGIRKKRQRLLKKRARSKKL